MTDRTITTIVVATGLKPVTYKYRYTNRLTAGKVYKILMQEFGVPKGARYTVSEWSKFCYIGSGDNMVRLSINTMDASKYSNVHFIKSTIQYMLEGEL